MLGLLCGIFVIFFFQAVDEEQAVCVRAAFVCYA